MFLQHYIQLQYQYFLQDSTAAPRPLLQIFFASFSHKKLVSKQELQVRLMSNFLLPVEVFCCHIAGFTANGNSGRWQRKPCYSYVQEASYCQTIKQAFHNN